MYKVCDMDDLVFSDIYLKSGVIKSNILSGSGRASLQAVTGQLFTPESLHYKLPQWENMPVCMYHIVYV